jgi:hypothetical protein
MIYIGYAVITMLIWPIATLVIAKLVSGSHIPDDNDWAFSTITGFMYALCWIGVVPVCLVAGLIWITYNLGFKYIYHFIIYNLKKLYIVLFMGD